MSGSILSVGRRRIRPALRLLPSYHFAANHLVELDFGAEEVVDLAIRDGLREFDTVFFLDIEQGFFQSELIFVVAIYLVGLLDLPRILMVDGPESLRFFRRKVKTIGKPSDLKGFNSSLPLWFGLRL